MYLFPHNKQEYMIGVISDTHGLLRPEVIKVLHGSDLIIHAGDIGDPAIVKRLNEIAPVAAIRGNVDDSPALYKLPLSEEIEIGGKKIFIIHNINELSINPEVEKIDIVVFGHSHKSLLEKNKNVLYFNPGSAGKKRFHYPISVGEIKIKPDEIIPRIIEF